LAGKLKVLIVSSEVVPFAKTGGLADVAGALPIALEEQGVDVRLAMPKYKMVKSDSDSATIGKNVKVYFIKNDKFFKRDGLYGDIKGDYPDNLERFVFFNTAVLDLLKKIKFKPDVIHCNDWQAGLIPVYLKTIYKDDPFFKDTKTVFTIHNLAYQGTFPKDDIQKTALGWDVFTMDGIEFYNKINFLKGGLNFSDALTTVSPTYAEEIQLQEFGCGLEGALSKRKDDLFGIINGIDYDIWNPAKDKCIFKNYSADTIDGKYVNKTMLQKETGLKEDKNTPLLGIISRLADQKGFDLIAAIINDLLKMGTQIIILGTGEEKYHIMLKDLAKKHPKATSINLRFDNTLACKIYAGCDMFLMPSRYEPCGLGQMISLAYGTIPVVRQTGGLRDTVMEFNPRTKDGNGFVFRQYNSSALQDAIKRGLEIYKDRKLWKELVQKAMIYDYSWNESAVKYIEVYKKAISKK